MVSQKEARCLSKAEAITEDTEAVAVEAVAPLTELEAVEEVDSTVFHNLHKRSVASRSARMPPLNSSIFLSLRIFEA